MKRNLFQALENADHEMSVKNQVKIDSELLSHISGGKSSGNLCTVSGECNSDGHSCSKKEDCKLEDVIDYIWTGIKYRCGIY